MGKRPTPPTAAFDMKGKQMVGHWHDSEERTWTERQVVQGISPARVVLVCLLLVCFVGSAEARYCFSTSCVMCARLFGPLPGDRTGINLPGYGPSGVRLPATSSFVGASAGPFSVYDPTPEDAVQFILDQLDLGPDDVLYDLGCGDARILIAAVERFGCRGVGIEIDPKVAKLARSRIRLAGCQRIRIVLGDARNYSYDQADAVVMYLFPNLMAELLPKIDCPVVSYLHPIEGRSAKRIKGPGRHEVYVSRTRSANLRVQ